LAGQLAAEGVEHGGGVAMGLDRDEGGAADLAGAHQPAGEFAGERGLALPALAADQGPALRLGGAGGPRAERPLQGQQVAAAPDEAGLGRLGERAESGLEDGPQVLAHLGGEPREVGRREERRVGLALVEDRDEPVGEAQVTGAQDLAAEVVVLEPALALQHGVADPAARGERPVEGVYEAPGGLDQHRVAHGDHRADPDLEQPRGDGFGGVLGLGALAGIQKDQRDAVVAQHRTQGVGVHQEMPAPVRAVAVARVLEAETAQAHPAVVDPVAVEMDAVVGGARIEGAFEFRAQGREGRGLKEAQIDQAAQVLHGLDQR
jgi:hypothetical protein